MLMIRDELKYLMSKLEWLQLTREKSIQENQIICQSTASIEESLNEWKEKLKIKQSTNRSAMLAHEKKLVTNLKTLERQNSYLQEKNKRLSKEFKESETEIEALSILVSQLVCSENQLSLQLPLLCEALHGSEEGANPLLSATLLLLADSIINKPDTQS
eukprot:TRINITY_DN1597_c0_g2_i1.p1 TRINITY_DN1597_c0_g2~~TRINITY_DN1597_c0_g2_i1.p1  ORF type:complete len:159 (-),score=23.00 TRINITY_DN1597_c0_g2_i1:48-524(-)